MSPPAYLWQMCFNPRGCASRDHRNRSRDMTKRKFQSTRLREPRHWEPVYAFARPEFQSTRLREPRHESPRLDCHPSPSFNPRGCASRDATSIWFARLARVSIHAAARAATRSFITPFLAFAVSIHAAARAATMFSPGEKLVCVFQSTRLREPRPPATACRPRSFRFNPRGCASRDP